MNLSSSLALIPLALRLEHTQGLIRARNSLDYNKFTSENVSAAHAHCARDLSIMRNHCKTSVELCFTQLHDPSQTQEPDCFQQWLACTNKALGLHDVCLKNTRQLTHDTNETEKDLPIQQHSDNEHSNSAYSTLAWIFSTLAVFSLLDLLRRHVCCPQQEVEIHEQNEYARDRSCAFSCQADLAFSNGDPRKPKLTFPEYCQLDTVAEDAPNPTQETDLITLDGYDEIMKLKREIAQPVRIGYKDDQGQRKFFPQVMRYDSVKQIVATAFSKNENPEYPTTRQTFGPKDIFQERPYLETSYRPVQLQPSSVVIPEGTNDADQTINTSRQANEIELTPEAQIV